MRVIVRENNVEQAIRILRKKGNLEGIFRIAKNRMGFKKPSEQRKEKKAQAQRRRRRALRQRYEREGY